MKNNILLKEKDRWECSLQIIGSEEISKQSLQIIISTAIQYSLEFDLLVPPYDTVKIATVGQAEAKIQHSRVMTGKRLGFQFNSDDVLMGNSH